MATRPASSSRSSSRASASRSSKRPRISVRSSKWCGAASGGTAYDASSSSSSGGGEGWGGWGATMSETCKNRRGAARACRARTSAARACLVGRGWRTRPTCASRPSAWQLKDFAAGPTCGRCCLAGDAAGVCATAGARPRPRVSSSCARPARRACCLSSAVVGRWPCDVSGRDALSRTDGVAPRDASEKSALSTRSPLAYAAAPAASGPSPPWASVSGVRDRSPRPASPSPRRRASSSSRCASSTRLFVSSNDLRSQAAWVRGLARSSPRLEDGRDAVGSPRHGVPDGSPRQSRAPSSTTSNQGMRCPTASRSSANSVSSLKPVAGPDASVPVGRSASCCA
mmetsp:Transcript_19010/g.65379  ORF Transcript_19010/g.65379 Transcript_19010/m.65379 type:complete len:341 (-) Transcript_19010:604-1626(-)